MSDFYLVWQEDGLLYVDTKSETGGNVDTLIIVAKKRNKIFEKRIRDYQWLR